MADWRWVTQIKHTPSPGSVLPPIENGQWIDFDGLDSIMPLAPGRYNSARTRLGWLTDTGWHFLFVAEQIDPTAWSGEQQPTTLERTTNADSALESTQEP